MAIITISRELAALGDETAQQLAKSMDYRFVDKHALEERMKSYGIETRELKKYDERKPSFLASFSQDRDNYLHYLKTAVFAEAEPGNCVFIGRGAGTMFKNMPGHISMFLAAPFDVRIERVKSYFHCDERRARQVIEHSDQNRLGFHRYFFDIDWRDPGNYHLTLNTGVFSPATCAEIINQFKDQIFTPEAETRNAIRLRELILEQRIKHHIQYDREIIIHFLEVSVSGNSITLHGVVNSQALVDAALAAAFETIAGKAETEITVKSEIQVVREYSIIP